MPAAASKWEEMQTESLWPSLAHVVTKSWHASSASATHMLEGVEGGQPSEGSLPGHIPASAHRRDCLSLFLNDGYSSVQAAEELQEKVALSTPASSWEILLVVGGNRRLVGMKQFTWHQPSGVTHRLLQEVPVLHPRKFFMPPENRSAMMGASRGHSRWSR